MQTSRAMRIALFIYGLLTIVLLYLPLVSK